LSFTRLTAAHTVRFSHRSDYSGEPTGRPVLDIEFAATDRHGALTGAHETGVMVDTGAAITMLGCDVADALGLNPKELPLRFLEGAVPGRQLPCGEASVMARLCDVWVQIPVIFPTEPVTVRHVLGRAGVFDHVRFGFGGGEQALYGAF
jgi:hypothetical protein